MSGELVVCRHGFTVAIPCNWVNKGFCGIDGKRCAIRRILKDEC